MIRPDDPVWSRWGEIDDHLAYLLELEASERDAELARRCAGDAELEETLRALLAASARADRFESGPSAELVTAALDEGGTADAPPERIGPYRVIRRLGRGGMGTVYLAERDDPSFPNRVALKLLRRGVDTEDVLARFRSERQILASLHHPGIATVFDAGTSEDGRPFLVMEHVAGLPLTAHCDASRLDVRGRVRLFMAVLRAVSHAHAHGVVHRDLKPSNILVTREEAHIKLLDFGIAKLLDRGGVRAGAHGCGTPPTGPATRPMTPGFASPEQVLGQAITEASDVYQLGLLLHELLTGTRPFADSSGREYERRVATTEPDLPSRTLRTQPTPGDVPMEGVADTRELSRILAGDLDAIVLRCLQRDPDARYESVDALHADLVRYLEGRPVTARRARRSYRLAKHVRRRARSLALPAVAAVALAASWAVFAGPFAPARFDGPVPPAGVTTSNPRAYAFYVEGLTAFGAGDNRVADRFFHAALDEDTAFAMAAYYASRTAELDEPAASIHLINRAHRLADGASDLERLVIQTHWADRMEDPALLGLADSLARLFPSEPEGHYRRGVALIHAGRFLEAIESLERAVDLDSEALDGGEGPCIACDALRRLINAQILADSMDAAVRTGKRWTSLQPESARAWHSLASALINLERYDEALEAQGRAAALRSGHVVDPIFPGMVAVHRGDFEAADRLFRLHLGTGTTRMRINAAHWLGISLRTQGRWSEAAGAADALLDIARTQPPGDRRDVLGQISRALALLGAGEAAAAAELFEASGRTFDERAQSWTGRDRAWNLTHAGTARAAAGDTTALKDLIGRVEAAGALSVYARDQRLHHYLRALLARARGAPETSVERHLRASLYSLSSGYSRINLELGESLLRQRRYAEAAAVAGAALRNSMESNGLYATRTDCHELLGRIWHAAGVRDSASLHLRAARDAWRRADPNMRPRVANLERLLAEVS